ncbi:hypothetical protein, partial [Actinoallomurus soli]|uniref:hypothetical protein n=1 Tax=Actinoallomurus soli TaxID=2952535 RepID=UPI002092237A
SARPALDLSTTQQSTDRPPAQTLATSQHFQDHPPALTDARQQAASVERLAERARVSAYSLKCRAKYG